MIQHFSHVLSKRGMSVVFMAIALFIVTVSPIYGMDSVRNGPLPQPLPLFPPDNWWNLDISSWPVDPNSSSYIGFVNNGGTRRLHPDFGGNAGTSQNPYAIYGLPYAIVSGVTNAELRAVAFYYSRESDGVDHTTGTSYPFYPIPPEAITQPYWIEGGDPGNVDLRSSQDRHLLIVDSDRNHLYELYNVYYDPAEGKWFAGSGAFFDMNTSSRRPAGWTSADAAGLAILPGLIRYDEVYDPNIPEIRHAFRVTVRSTNGYVYPASHRAGSTVGALPMGARLRLKASVDVTQRTSDPNIQKIFRAMQKHGLIVADNGSDMYVTGTYDTRWNNDILNPAFRALTANDFEVIQLGYRPSVETAELSSVSMNPSIVTGGQSATGTVNLTAPAPAGGSVISVSNSNSAASVPTGVSIAANSTSANFTITTSSVSSTTMGNITASYSGITKTGTFTVQPQLTALSSLTLNPATVSGGSSTTGTVILSAPAPAGGIVVNLSSNKPAKATVPSSVTISAGASAANFTVTTAVARRNTSASIGASYAGASKSAMLIIQRRRR